MSFSRYTTLTSFISRKKISNHQAEELKRLIDEPIVIYEQTPFDNDYMLVLTDRMTEGEHYPNLYLVSSDGIVSSLTRHSHCWTLNFTELSGYKVYFGLAGKGVNQANNNSISVNKVEAIFGNKVETVEPRKSAYAYFNLDEKDVGTIYSFFGLKRTLNYFHI